MVVGGTSNPQVRLHSLQKTIYPREDPEVVTGAEENFKQARRSLKQGITKAKARAWEELIREVDEDP